MRFSRKYWDLGFLGALVGGFLFVASQRIGAVPIPDDGDESMLLQVPYEIIHRGKFGWPMYRYLGGNIENVWHSFRPALFLMEAGFFKIFGWGLAQGRVFNVLTAAGTLIMVYLVGRRLFDWRAGMAAVVMLISDQTFVERSRMVRYEHPGALFALLTFYLYELAEESGKARYYVASGLAAGWSVMIHTNLAYLVIAMLALMLLRHRARALVSKPLYYFGGAVLLVISYEIISGLADLQNVRLQYRGDPAHFPIHSPSSLWTDLILETRRYAAWYRGGELIWAGSPVLLHVFQLLTLVSIIYLVVACVTNIKRGNAATDPRGQILVMTVIAMLFVALVTGHKRKYVIYMPYLTPWFALCVGILVRDGMDYLKSLPARGWRISPMVRRAGATALFGLVMWYGLLFMRQNYRYYKAVNNLDQASFHEFATVLRGIVPKETCPISVLRPVIWLAFPEHDQCYATLEGRMGEISGITGNEYALIVPSKKNLDWMSDPDETFHCLGEMEATPYGDLRVYYMGTNPDLMKITPKRYKFFGYRAGHVETDQLALRP